MNFTTRTSSALAGGFFLLALQVWALPWLFALFTDDLELERREWLLRGPGLLQGMGGGPNQLWGLMVCALVGLVCLLLGRWFWKRGQEGASTGEGRQPFP